MIDPDVIREKLARALCHADGLDPDAIGFGLGITMPKDAKFPLWQGRLRQVDAMMLELNRMEDDIRAFTQSILFQNLRTVINEQAEDDSCWFIAETAAEAYLQSKLRQLHAVAEQAFEHV